jgi:hypothetical protein
MAVVSNMMRLYNDNELFILVIAQEVAVMYLMLQG